LPLASILFRAPSFLDQSNSRSANIIYRIGWLFTGIIILNEGLLLLYSLPSSRPMNLGIIFTALGIQLINVWLIRSGKLYIASYIFTIVIVPLYFILLVRSGGHDSPFFIGFPIIYLLAILIIDRKKSPLIGAIGIVSMIIMFAYEIIILDNIEVQFSFPPVVYALSTVIFAIILLYAISFVLKQFQYFASDFGGTTEMLKSAQKIAHFGNWEWDIETNELKWSEEVYEIFELEDINHPLTFQDFLDRIPNEDRVLVKTFIDRALTKNKTYEIEHQISLPNGGMKTVREWGMVNRNEDGKPVGMSGALQDITSQKEMQTELSEMNKSLIILNEIMLEVLGSESVEEIIEKSVELSYPLITYDLAGVLSIDEEKKHCIAKGMSIVGKSFDIPLTHNIKIPTDIAAMEKLFSEVPYYLVKDLQDKESLNKGEDFIAALGIRSYLGIPMVINDVLTGVLFFGSREPNQFTQEHGNNLLSIANALSLALQQVELIQRIRSGRNKLQILTKELVRIQEKERRYLAGELHDEIGQSLTGIKYQLEALIPWPDKEGNEDLVRAYNLVDDLINAVREMSLALRPSMLDDLGLLPTLLWHVKRFQDMTGIHITLNHEAINCRFDIELETAAYRIVQEGLTNIARHAKADQASVNVIAKDNCIHIQIQDNGFGFDTNTIKVDYEHFGLIGMQERANSFGGIFKIESSEGEGTLLEATLPIVGHCIERRKGQRTQS
jgi:signal transduction histidine kinase/PAS domain-containing protein